MGRPQVGEQPVVKWSLSIPGELADEVDAARREEPMVNGRHVKRSEWIQQAIRERLEREAVGA